MVYVIITILFVILSGKLFKRGCGTISPYRPNMMSVIFYYYLLLQCVIGALLVVNHWDNHYIIDKLMFESSRKLGYWAVMYTIISFPIGMIAANKILRVNNISYLFDSYCSEKITIESKYKSKNLKFLLVLLSVICVLSVVYVLYEIREIPIFKMFGSSTMLDLAGFRSDVSRNFPGNIYIKNVFGLGLTPLMSYVAFGYKNIHNSFANKVWFWSMFTFSVLILSYNLEKSPIIIYLIGFIFFRVYTNHTLTKKQISIIFICVLSLIIFLYLKTMDSGSDLILFAYNTGIIGRLTLSSIAGLFMNFDLWPATYDFLGFSSFPQYISEIFGLEYSERSARLVMEAANPLGIKEGVAGVMNTLFIGEAYSNWGFYGALISPIWVGFIIQCLYVFFLKSHKSPFFLGLFIDFSFKSGITGGANEYFFNTNILVYIVIILLLYRLSYKYSTSQIV